MADSWGTLHDALCSPDADARGAALRALCDWGPLPVGAALITAARMFSLGASTELDASLSQTRLRGPRVDCIAVLHELATAAPAAAAADPFFWTAVHWAVRLGENGTAPRKLGRATLALGIAALSAAAAAAGTLSASAVATWDGVVFLLAAFEDFPLYLLAEVWAARAPPLLEALSLAGGVAWRAGDVDGPSTVPPPSLTCDGPLPFVWASVLIDRALCHDNPAVRRALMQQFLCVAVSGGDAPAAAHHHAETLPPLMLAVPQSRVGGSAAPPLLVPYGLLMPPWYIAGGGAVAVPACGASDAAPPELAQLGSLVAPLTDNALFHGAEDVVGVALGRFLKCYIKRLGAEPAAAPLLPSAVSETPTVVAGSDADPDMTADGAALAPFIRRLIREARALVHCRGACRRIMRAIADAAPPAVDAPASPAVIDVEALTAMQAQLLAMSCLNTRAFTAARWRDALDVLLAWGGAAGDPRLPFECLFHFLAAMPAAILLVPRIDEQPRCTSSVEPVAAMSYLTATRHDSVGATDAAMTADPGSSSSSSNNGSSGYCAVTAWIQRSPGGRAAAVARVNSAVAAYLAASSPSMASAPDPPLGATAPERLRAGGRAPTVDGAVAGSGTGHCEPSLSAAAIARAIVLLPPPPSSPPRPGDDGAVGLDLQPLAAALSALHSHPYMPPHVAVRAQLLTFAVLAATQPRRRIADAAASPYVQLSLPPHTAAAMHPLFVELDAAGARARVAARITWRGAHSADAAAAPDDEYLTEGAAVPQSHGAVPMHLEWTHRAIRSVLLDGDVAAALAATLEAAVSAAVSLTVPPSAPAGTGWSPDHGMHAPPTPAYDDADGPRGVPPLSFAFRLDLLHECVMVTSTSTLPLGGGSNPFAAAAYRVVRAAIDVIAVPRRDNGAQQSAAAAHMLPAAAAEVQRVNALHALATLAPVALSPASSDGDSLVQLVDALLRYSLRRPRGAADPALPVQVLPSGTAPLPLGVETSWVALRSFAEACRWTALAAVLRGVSPIALRRGALVAEIVSAVAEGLRSATATYMHAVLDAAAAVLPLLAVDDGESGASFEAVLDAAAVGYRQPHTSRRTLTAAFAALFAPALLLRCARFSAEQPQHPPAVGGSGAATSAAGVSGGRSTATARTGTRQRGGNSSSGSSKRSPSPVPTPGPPLRAHLDATVAWAASGGTGVAAAPTYAAPLLAARLVLSWRALLGVASGGGDDAAAASVLLSSFTPTMLLLVLHREDTMLLDTPPFADAASVAQMAAWMREWRATAEPSSWWATGLPPVLRQLAACAPRQGGGDAPQDGAQPARAAAAAVDELPPTLVAALAPLPFTAADDDGSPAALRRRGAGYLARTQLLCFFDELSRAAARERGALLLAVARGPGAAAGPARPAAAAVATRLTAELMSQLLALNEAPAWQEEAGPGTAVHAAKLRAWQATALLLGDWGAAAVPPTAAACADTGSGSGTPCACGGGSGGGYCAPMDGAPAACGGRAWHFFPAVDCYLPATALKLQSCCGAADGAAASKGEGAPDGAGLSAVAAIAAALPSMAQCALVAPNLPSVRHYIEAGLAAVAHRFPTLALRLFIEPVLERPNGRPVQTISAATVCAELIRHLARNAIPAAPPAASAALTRVAAAAFRCLVPLLSTPVGLARCLAQTGAMEAAPLLMPAALWAAVTDDATDPVALRRAAAAGSGEDVDDYGDDRCSAVDGADARRSSQPLPPAPPALAPLLPLLRHIAVARDVRVMVGRQSRHLARLSALPAPAAATSGAPAVRPATSLEGLLLAGRVEHGELLPEDVFSALRAEFTAAADALHTGGDAYGATDEETLGAGTMAQLRSGALPPAALYDARLRGGATAGGGSPGTAAAAAPFNFQRKLFSELTGTGAGVGGAAPVAPAPRRPLPPPASVLTAVSATGRACQPLIIVASLVDRVPNLGGLARTAEVFALEALLLPDARIARDAGFRDVSVSAADHVDLGELPPSVPAIAAYLRAKRAQGYAIVGLEQTARSERLGAAGGARLPPRAVLLLGAEKEGVPAALLRELDVVLEIPQLGRIRSLNVHVSAAMVVWEFTRQRLDDAAAAVAGAT